MERVNYTTKCNKCLQCSEYMYSCRGSSNFNKVEKCEDYSIDEHAYVRQDQDETYIKPVSQLNKEIDNSIQFHNQYKTKTYIYDVDNELLISTCYTTEVPKIKEEIILHREGIFEHYIVSERKLGVNGDNGATVWNLYVRKIN